MINMSDILKEAVVKEISDVKEVDKKLSPNELLNKSQELGISGNNSEIEIMKREEIENTAIEYENKILKEQKLPNDILEEQLPDDILGKFPSKESKLPDDIILVPHDEHKFPEYKLPKERRFPYDIVYEKLLGGAVFDSNIVRDNIDIEKEQEKIKEKSNYSDKINEYITTEEELDIYKQEGLEESEINGRVVLKDNSIDPDLKDSEGRTNLERMEKGLAPLDENGKPYNLHHIGQKPDSPLAELKSSTHSKNDSVLHDKSNKTEIHNSDSGVNWDKQRSDYWKARAEDIKQERNQNV